MEKMRASNFVEPVNMAAHWGSRPAERRRNDGGLAEAATFPKPGLIPWCWRYQCEACAWPPVGSGAATGQRPLLLFLRRSTPIRILMVLMTYDILGNTVAQAT